MEKVPHLTPQLPLARGSHEPKRCWRASLYNRLILRECMNWQIAVSDSDWASTSLALSDTPQFQGFTSPRFLFRTSYFCLLKEMFLFSHSGKRCGRCYAATAIHHWLIAISEIHIRSVLPFLFFSCPLNRTGILGHCRSPIGFWPMLVNAMPPKFLGNLIFSKVT